MPRSDPLSGAPRDDPFVAALAASLRPVATWGTFRRGARHAAVNIILFHRDAQWHIPFVLRRPDLRSHPGQVGLPGGGVQPGETALAAALRESEEEIGVPARALRVLGAAGGLYAAVTNYSVATFVSTLERPPESFVWDPGELAGVIEVPVTTLLDEGAWSETGPFFGPQLPTQGVVIWGLTAALLRRGILDRLRAALEGP